MMKRLLNRFFDHYGSWRLIWFGLVAAIGGLSLMLLLELVVPIRLDTNPMGIAIDPNVAGFGHVSEVFRPQVAGIQELTKVFRPGLFKASTTLGDRPLADKTIERIRSQLSLKSILTINGEPTVYIDVKGQGLEKCRVGDSVGDLFTVLSINKNTVEILIIGHKVTLGY